MPKGYPHFCQLEASEPVDQDYFSLTPLSSRVGKSDDMRRYPRVIHTFVNYGQASLLNTETFLVSHTKIEELRRSDFLITNWEYLGAKALLLSTTPHFCYRDSRVWWHTKTPDGYPHTHFCYRDSRVRWHAETPNGYPHTHLLLSWLKIQVACGATRWLSAHTTSAGTDPYIM